MNLRPEWKPMVFWNFHKKNSKNDTKQRKKLSFFYYHFSYVDLDQTLQ